MKIVIDTDKWRTFFKQKMENISDNDHFDEGYASGLSDAWDWIFGQQEEEK